MTQALGYCALFLITLVVQASFVTSLSLPFSTIPLMLLIGILVMHRSETYFGALWMILSGVLLPLFSPSSGTFFAYVAAAIAGTLLMNRVFTNRSAYALFGLGGSLYIHICHCKICLRNEI